MRDAVATMGNILPDDVGGRDAVHVAVISVIADEILTPGEDVGVTEQANGEHLASGSVDPVGIVDPFIKGLVKKGQRFWLYLYPRTITGLNHSWSHPAFPDRQPKPDLTRDASERWLRQFCADNDVPYYEQLLEFVRYHHEDRWGDGMGRALYIGDMDSQANIPPEFWDHIEVVTGLKFKPEVRAEYFRCAC